MLIANKHFTLSVPPRSYLAVLLQQHGTYEEAETQLLLSLVKEGDWFVDVGAHVGWFSTILANQGAWVTAVEPNPRLLPYLVENLSSYLARAVIHPYAAFETNGEAEFYLPSTYNDGWGSLAAPDPHGLGQKTKVTLRRLDSLLWTEQRIKVLKLDVEGVELSVLRGLGERLSEVEHVLVELVDRPERTWKFGSTRAGVEAILHGWKVTPISEQNFLFTNPAVAALAKVPVPVLDRLEERV